MPSHPSSSTVSSTNGTLRTPAADPPTRDGDGPQEARSHSTEYNEKTPYTPDDIESHSGHDSQLPKSLKAINEKADSIHSAHDPAISPDSDIDLAEVAFNDSVWAKYHDNPHNWPTAKKWRMAGIVSSYTFISPLASSMLAPSLASLAEHYHITNSTVEALTLSIFILAYCLGPLIVSPLSEMYGRRMILHLSNALFLVFNLLCAWAPNTTCLIIFRFIAGLGGATPIAIGGSVIGDVFTPAERAASMAMYTMGPLMGPVVGPIAGGFITETVGFKWIFIVLTVCGALTLIVGVPFLQETYHPVLRARIAEKATGDKERAKALIEGAYKGMSKTQFLWVNLSRPIVLMGKSFILDILSLFMAIQYGFLYLMFTTFPIVFTKEYGFNTGTSGLAYIGIGGGFLLATMFGATFSNTVYLKLVERNGGVAKPEFRIPTMLVGSLMVPVGLFWYGWTSRSSVHWIVPIIGSGVMAAGMMTTYLPIQLYIVDTFTYAASALATASVVRSILGFAFPLFAFQMFEALGNGPGYSLLGGLAILIGWPFPVWIYFYGERVRARSEVNR